MRISELIAKLQEAMAEHGDLPVEIPTDYQLGDGDPTEAESVDLRDGHGCQAAAVIIRG